MPELTPEVLALGALWYAVFVFSTTCHEAAHALAGHLLGDSTAYDGGQVTLNPLPHIRRAFFGMVVIPIASFLLSGFMIGFASAPYDPQWALRHPRRSAWMSLAGPAANLLIVILAGLGIRIGLAVGVFAAPDSPGFSAMTVPAEGAGTTVALLATGLSVAFALNLLLFVFNLLPVPPLDGSGALPLLMPQDLARKYMMFLFTNPMLAWMGILVAWRAFDYIFSPVFLWALRALYPGVGYAPV
jgi:Zn-dependent protease